MEALTVPTNLACAVADEGREAWLDTLPAAIEHAARRWNLAVGEAYQPGGGTAWVAPVESGMEKTSS